MCGPGKRLTQAMKSLPSDHKRPFAGFTGPVENWKGRLEEQGAAQQPGAWSAALAADCEFSQHVPGEHVLESAALGFTGDSFSDYR